MNKLEFLEALRARISGLPKNDIDERLSFYGEMIDDRIEDGKSEDEAINEIGTPDEVASQIVASTPLSKIVKEKIKPKRQIKAWEIVLLVLGSPIWLSILVAVLAVVLSLYVVIWSVAISLWAVFTSLAVSAPAVLVVGFVALFTGQYASGTIAFATALLAGGLAILLFFGCLETTKGILKLTKMLILSIKKCLVKRKDVTQ